MPGIFGIVSADRNAPPAAQWATSMREILRHHSTYKDYVFESTGCALGGSTPAYFNAIVRPAFSGDHSLCLVMEGEIFNGEELRAELTSKGLYAEAANDAELMMRLYEAFRSGLAHKVNGLYILAVWNAAESSLTLINDRVGLHNLYYYEGPRYFAFAPEMKALLTNAVVPRQVDPEAVADFFTFGSVFGNRTLLRDIRLMPPGTILRYCAGKLTSNRYWDFPFAEPAQGRSRRDYVEELDHIFRRVITRQTSDRCRYGLALSGGRDSRIFAGYLGAVASPLHTFTFGDPVTDEVRVARKVSDLVGAQYHHVDNAFADLPGSFEKVVWLTEGPINTPEYYRLGMTLRENVDVAFNGHGGDVLGGRWVSRHICTARDLAPVQEETYARYSRRMGGHPAEEFYSPSYAPLVMGVARRNFLASFAGLQTNQPGLAQLKQEMLTKNWREYARVMDVPRLFVRYRYPLFDYEVLDFFLALPLSMRYQERVYLGVLLDKFPRLADVRYPNRRFSLRAEQRYLKTYYALRNKWGHRLVDKFYRRLGRLTPASAVGPIDQAYRGQDGDRIRSWLMEGNQRRGYFNSDHLEHLWRENAVGEADHSFLIHKLVTFELFNRLLLDSERPARPEGDLL